MNRLFHCVFRALLGRGFKQASAVIFVASMLVACGGGGGGDATTTSVPIAGGTVLITNTPQASSATCPNGGSSIDAGLDTNSNGVLEPSEITSTNLVCSTTGPTNTVTVPVPNTVTNTVTVPVPSTVTVTLTNTVTNTVTVPVPTTVTVILTLTNTVTNTVTVPVPIAGAVIFTTTALPLGSAQCPLGGVLISAGADSSGDGVLQTGEITSVSLVCQTRNPDWETSQPMGTRTVLSPDFSHMSESDIAINNAGSRVQVWATKDGVQAAIALPGQDWQRPQIVSTPSTQSQDVRFILNVATLPFRANFFELAVLRPRVAIDAAGNAVVAWLQAAGIAGDLRLWASRYTAGTGWAAPEQLGLSSTLSGIVMDAAGNAMLATSIISSAAPESLKVWRFSPSSGWTVSFAISDADQAGGRFNFRAQGLNKIQLSMHPNGKAIMVWRDIDRTDAKIYFRAVFFDPLTAWSAPQKLAQDTDTNDNADPLPSASAAINASGAALVALPILPLSEVFTAIKPNLVYSYNPSTGWGTTPTSLARAYTPVAPSDITNRAIYMTQLALDDAGNALAVWRENIQEGSAFFVTNRRMQLVSSRYTPAAGWGLPQVLAQAFNGLIDPLFGDIRTPRLAMDASGNATLAWSQQLFDLTVSANRFTAVQGNSGVFVASYPVNGFGWSAARRISSAANTFNSTPELSVAVNGLAAINWREDASALAVSSGAVVVDFGPFLSRNLILKSQQIYSTVFR
jgi:hypothetical protein